MPFYDTLVPPAQGYRKTLRDVLYLDNLSGMDFATRIILIVFCVAGLAVSVDLLMPRASRFVKFMVCVWLYNLTLFAASLEKIL